MGSAKRRFAKGIAANFYALGAYFLSVFIQLPLLKHYWGEEGVSIWNQMVAIQTFLLLVGQPSMAVSNEMAMAEGRGDHDEAVSQYQSGLMGQTVLSLLAGVGAACLLPFVSLQGFVQAQSVPESDLRAMALWIIASTVLAHQGGMLDAVRRAAGQYAFGQILMTTQRLIETAAGIGAVVLGGDLVQYWLWFAGAKVVLTIVLFVWQVRALPAWPIGFRHATWERVKGMIGPSVGHCAIPLALALNLDGVKTAVTMGMASAVASTNFTTMRTLSRVVWQMVLPLGNVLWVELSGALARGELETARGWHRRMSQVSVWMALVVTSGLAIVGGPLYTLWMGGKGFQYNAPAFLMMLVATIFMSLWGVSYMVPISMNRSQKVGFFFVVVHLIGALLAVPVSRAMGLVGVAGMLLVIEVVVTIYVWRIAFSILEEDPRVYFKQLMQPPFGWILEQVKKVRSRPSSEAVS